MNRPWDSYDAYLFDLDGTLLHAADGLHYYAFCDVLSTMAKRPLNLDGAFVHGNVDAGILRDALTGAGIPESVWRPQLDGMCAGLGEFVERRKNELQVQALPGACAVLAHLRERHALIGIATGNLAQIGQLKLEACGLGSSYDFASFSNGHEFRRDVVRAGLEEARRRLSPAAAVCMVGDTPTDIEAARDNGLDVIAVAGGIFSKEELSGYAPDLLISSLKELV